VAVASLCTIIPGYEPPTGSLSTTAALALCVFVAVPLFGIGTKVWAVTSSLRQADKSSCCRLTSSANFRGTLALAVRLFGNMMSGVMIIGILLTITTLSFRSS